MPAIFALTFCAAAFVGIVAIASTLSTYGREAMALRQSLASCSDEGFIRWTVTEQVPAVKLAAMRKPNKQIIRRKLPSRASVLPIAA